MARYRKLEVAVWTDSRFCELSAAPPNGQTLWLYLLSGPRTTTFPGLVVAKAEVMASDLGWPVEAFREAFREAFVDPSRKAMAKADWKVGLVVLPKALLDSTGEPRDTARPESPNVLRSWAKSWDEVPDCSLKYEYLQNLGSFAKALGEGYHQAFREAFRKALVKASPHPSPHPSPNQDQDQDQEQEQEQERETRAQAPVPVLAAGQSTTSEPAAYNPEVPGSKFKLAEQTYQQVSAARVRIAAKLGLPAQLPFPLITPATRPRGFSDLLERVAEEGAIAPEVCARVVASLVEQAEDTGAVEWLSVKAFTAGGWRTAREYVPGKRAGPASAPSKQDARFGRVEPKNPEEYPSGEQTL